MKANEIIAEIEISFQITQITCGKFQLWPILRKEIYFKLLNVQNNCTQLDQNKTKIDLLVKVSKKLKLFFYGLKNIIHKYQYFIFTSTNDLRIVDNKFRNKITHTLWEILGRDQTLIIEKSSVKVLHPNNSRIEKLISDQIIAPIYLLNKLKLRRVKINITGLDILEKIEERYQFNLNYYEIAKNFLSYTKTMNWIFKVYQPKLVVMSQYFGIFNQAIILAAKQNKIPVIEMQHGSLHKSHPQYNIHTKMSRITFPDYLFVFGDLHRKIFDNNNYFIGSNRVIPVGNMYLNYIKTEYKRKDSTRTLFDSYRRKYDKIIAISSQISVDDSLLNFTKKAAELAPQYLFIFIPRYMDKKYLRLALPENIVFIQSLNVYEILVEVDYHSTVYSTCAMEALALGIRNLMINIDNLAIHHMKLLLNNEKTTRYVDTPEQFVLNIEQWDTISKDEIIIENELFYKPNHKDNLRKAIKLIMNSYYN